MALHTDQEWRDLHSAVTALLADPATPVEKKRRAEDIMAMIRRNPAAMRAINEVPSVFDLGWTEYI